MGSRQGTLPCLWPAITLPLNRKDFFGLHLQPLPGHEQCLTGPGRKSIPVCTVSLFLLVHLRCSAQRALPIDGMELPSNICHVPLWALAYSSVAAQTLKTRVCYEDLNNFLSFYLLSSYLMRWKMNHQYDRSDPAFSCSWVNLTENCLQEINWLLDAKDWRCTLGTHPLNTAKVPASYTIEKKS